MTFVSHQRDSTSVILPFSSLHRRPLGPSLAFKKWLILGWSSSRRSPLTFLRYRNCVLFTSFVRCDMYAVVTKCLLPVLSPITTACGRALKEINTHQTAKINTFITLWYLLHCTASACYSWLEAEILRFKLPSSTLLSLRCGKKQTWAMWHKCGPFHWTRRQAVFFPDFFFFLKGGHELSRLLSILFI